MKLEVAERVADSVVRLLGPACAEIKVVGSVRRRREDVRDIELVVRSRPAAPVFGEPASAQSALAARVARLLLEGELRKCPDPKRRLDGPRQKRLYLPHPGLELEIFIAGPDNFGNLVAIRTGDFEFSRQLVTKWSEGGLMPRGLLHHEGYLRRPGGSVVSCPTEADFFAALRIDRPPPPQYRTLREAQRLRERLEAERETA